MGLIERIRTCRTVRIHLTQALGEEACKHQVNWGINQPIFQSCLEEGMSARPRGRFFNPPIALAR